MPLPARKVSDDPLVLSLVKQRIALGFTVREVAELMGQKSKTHVARVERGDVTPSLTFLNKYAEAVYMTINATPEY